MFQTMMSALHGGPASPSATSTRATQAAATPAPAAPARMAGDALHLGGLAEAEAVRAAARQRVVELAELAKSAMTPAELHAITIQLNAITRKMKALPKPAVVTPPPPSEALTAAARTLQARIDGQNAEIAKLHRDLRASSGQDQVKRLLLIDDRLRTLDALERVQGEGRRVAATPGVAAEITDRMAAILREAAGATTAQAFARLTLEASQLGR